jgi:hypothetical protein
LTTITMTLIDLEWHGRELPSLVLRREGLSAAAEAEAALQVAHPEAERLGRKALRALVDAFLGDRPANSDLFERAHSLGRRLCETVDCQWKPGEEAYTLKCPIYALHRPVAHSIAMTVTTECSICGSEALSCEHVPGEEYGGKRCVSEVTGISPLGHIAWTAEPDFVYTWHQPQEVPTEQLIRDGIIQEAGDDAFCTHCADCDGAPSEGDLDPVTRFEQLVAKARQDASGGGSADSSSASKCSAT